MPDIQDADSIEIQGSGAKPYVLKNTGGIYSRSCPAWRNQSVPRRMKRLNAFLLLVWGGAALSANADRINHAGRLLGPAPSVTNAVLFNKPLPDDFFFFDLPRWSFVIAAAVEIVVAVALILRRFTRITA